MKGMKNNKLKALAVAMVLTMSAGMIPTTAGIEVPALTTTVEAAAKKITLKASSKKVYAGKTVKINAKATKGAKLSYKTSNKKIATSILKALSQVRVQVQQRLPLQQRSQSTKL